MLRSLDFEGLLITLTNSINTVHLLSALQLDHLSLLLSAHITLKSADIDDKNPTKFKND